MFHHLPLVFPSFSLGFPTVFSLGKALAGAERASKARCRRRAAAGRGLVAAPGQDATGGPAEERKNHGENDGKTLAVGGLVAIFGIFPEILGMSSSQLTFIFFRGVAQPPTGLGR